MNKKLFRKFIHLIEIARALKPNFQTGRSFHMTAILDKNRIISIGINNYRKTHPFCARFDYKNALGNCYNPGVHSELSAFLKLGEENCEKYTFINIRIDNRGRLNNSKPCSGCVSLLSQIGFKKMYYTDNFGNICEL